MAVNGLDLGDVGFSLVADTAGLEKSLSTLRAFGNEVNKWEKGTSEASQKMASAFMRQERAMVSLYQKMTNLQAQGRRVEAPSVITANVTKSIDQYISKLSEVNKAGVPVARTQLEMQRAAAAASAEYNKAANSLKNWEAQTRKTAIAQQALATSSKKTADVFSLISRKGGPDELVQRTTAAMNTLEAVLQKPKARIGEIKTAVNAYNADIAKVINSLKGWEVQERALQAAQKQQASLQASSQNALTRAQTRVDNLVAGAKRSFVPDNILGDYNAIFTQFQTKVNAGIGSTKALARAQIELGAELGKVTQKVRDYTASQNAANQAEALAARATQRVRRINEAALSFNAPKGMIQTNAQNLQTYQSALFAGDRGAAANALTVLNQGLLKTQNALAGSTDKAQKFSSTLRGMERATILAAGPLSGIGARMAVMAALFESMSVKAAFAVAGVTAFGAAIGMLAVAGIRARLEFERWNSGLIAASGSIALVGGEMEYLTTTADKYGQSIRILAPAYVSFGTSARLANVSLKEQRDIFESFTIAGAALHWTAEQSQRAFLALEQMMSKGVVQSQEMKLQLGQVLPGAMEIAAMSIGKTTKEFMKMMEQGEVISSEMLPKFAEKVKQVFDAASKYGAKALQADINRFDTNKLFAFEAIDRAIKASIAFQATLREINDLLVWVKDNADKVFAGFVAGAAMIAVLYLPAIIGGLVKVIAHFKALTLLSTVFMATTPLGWVKALASLVAVAGAGVITYKALTQRTSEVTDKTQDLINKTAVAIGQYEVLGTISKREKEAHVEALNEGVRLAKERIKYLQEQNKAILDSAKATLTAAQAQVILNKAYTGILGKDPKSMGFFEQWARTLSAAQSPGALPSQVKKKAEESKKQWEASSPQARAQTEIKMLEDQVAQMEKNISKLNEMKESASASASTGESSAKKLKDAYEGVYNSVAKMVTEFSRLNNTQKAISESRYNDLPLIEAQKKIDDFFEGMKNKTKQSFMSKLMKDFGGQIKAMGIEGDNFEEILLQLVLRTDQLEQSTNNWLGALKDLPKARQEVEDFTKAIEEQLRVLEAKRAGGDAAAKPVERAIKREQQIKDAMEKFWSNDVMLSPNNIGDTAADWDKVKEAMDKVFANEDYFNMLEDLKQQYADVMDVISSTEESMQSRVIAGIETETSARNQLMDLYKKQGDALVKDLIPKLEQMRDISTDPAIIAALTAQISKIKELQSMGSMKSTERGIYEGFEQYFANSTPYDQYKKLTIDTLNDIDAAINDFVENGTSNFERFAKEIIKNILAVILKVELMNMVMSSFGYTQSATGSWMKGSVGSTASSFGSSLLNPISMGQMIPSFSGSDQNILGSFFSLFGMASGGSFKVGGTGSTDSQLVAFMASPDEEVTVRTPSQQSRAREMGNNSSGSTYVNNITIKSDNPSSVRASRGQIAADFHQQLAITQRRWS